MRNFTKILLFCSLFAMIVGCDGILDNFISDDPVVAQIDHEVLLQSELSKIGNGVSEDDSIALTDAYIEQWSRGKVKMKAAEAMFENGGVDIERKVEDYRKVLLNNRLEQYVVDGNIDTVFTHEQIKAFYNENINNFILNRDIVKGIVVEVPEKYRQHTTLKKLMSSKKQSDKDDFKALYLKSDFNLMEFDQWVDFSEFIAQLPLSRDNNHDRLLSNKGVQELSSDGIKYNFIITEVMRKGDKIPLEQIEGAIRRTLYNQRKVELLQKYEDSLYRNALKDGALVIHRDSNKNKLN